MLALAAKKGQPYDPHFLLKSIPLNYLTRIFMGTRMDSETEEILNTNKHATAKKFDAVELTHLVERTIMVLFTPSLGAVFPLLFYVDPVCREAVKLVAEFQEFTLELLRQHEAGKLPNAVLLQDFSQRLKSGELTAHQLYQVVSVVFAGGTDTV